MNSTRILADARNRCDPIQCDLLVRRGDGVCADSQFQPATDSCIFDHFNDCINPVFCPSTQGPLAAGNPDSKAYLNDDPLGGADAVSEHAQIAAIPIKLAEHIEPEGIPQEY